MLRLNGGGGFPTRAHRRSRLIQSWLGGVGAWRPEASSLFGVLRLVAGRRTTGCTQTIDVVALWGAVVAVMALASRCLKPRPRPRGNSGHIVSVDPRRHGRGRRHRRARVCEVPTTSLPLSSFGFHVCVCVCVASHCNYSWGWLLRLPIPIPKGTLRNACLLQVSASVRQLPPCVSEDSCFLPCVKAHTTEDSDLHDQCAACIGQGGDCKHGDVSECLHCAIATCGRGSVSAKCAALGFQESAFLQRRG